jgi:hypothetical protein
MKNKDNKINRRHFLRTAGVAGLGSVFASGKAGADANDPNVPAANSAQKSELPALPQVPKRKLGRTGVEVPCLAMGGTVNLLDNQIMLQKALEWGITYWDTSDSYEGGNSELGIGKYIEKHPDMREKLFIVTKAFGTKAIEETEVHLQTSLQKMHTSYVDLYFIMDREKSEHGLSDPAQLDDRLKKWVKFAKRRKLIKYFGFSTHKNMPECLAAAANLDWIDAIMTSYNFRIMQEEKMQAAVDACHKAGIGLIAMKTQAQGQKIETDQDKKLCEHFLKSGFTAGQAKIKVVLQDQRISTVCSRMDNIGTMTENAAAALDKTALTSNDTEILARYAQATCSGYCAGCNRICDLALPNMQYVSEIMRYLMYYNCYGQQEQARELFAQIPVNVKNRLLTADYSDAEARCPQRMPIGKLMAEAVTKLA